MRRIGVGLVLVMLSVLPAGTASILPESLQGWERTTTGTLNYRIPGHEDTFRVPYINALGTTVKTEVKAGRTTWEYPKGTVIVKETYQGSGTPAQGAKPFRVYGMIKDPQHPKARGGWVWATRETATGKETIHESPVCVDCHNYANGKHPYGDKNPQGEFRDYVYFPYGKQGK